MVLGRWSEDIGDHTNIHGRARQDHANAEKRCTRGAARAVGRLAAGRERCGCGYLRWDTGAVMGMMKVQGATGA
jgi:hypothetical protein